MRRLLFDLSLPFVICWGLLIWFIANCGNGGDWQTWMEDHLS
jgi:hypothetical protein